MNKDKAIRTINTLISQYVIDMNTLGYLDTQRAEAIVALEMAKEALQKSTEGCPEGCDVNSLLEFVKQNTPNINGETTMECVERAIKVYFEGCPEGCTDNWDGK